jgi:hypothetical protein
MFDMSKMYQQSTLKAARKRHIDNMRLIQGPLRDDYWQ